MTPVICRACMQDEDTERQLVEARRERDEARMQAAIERSVCGRCTRRLADTCEHPVETQQAWEIDTLLGPKQIAWCACCGSIRVDGGEWDKATLRRGEPR